MIEERRLIEESLHLSEQQRIRLWFDENYRRRGFRYLRPLAAYAIYARLLDLRPDQTLLDVGCGPGLMLRQGLNAGSRAFGVDLSEEAIRMARTYVPEADTQVGNAESLPFATGSIDAITCLGSLERMIDLRQVLWEMRRVGRPDARYCFLVRNSANVTWRLLMEKLNLRNESGHQGAKSLIEWQQLLMESGFELIDVLPDQWPFVRWRQVATLGLYRPDPTRIRRGVKPLDQAYEFVFVLRKRSPYV